MIAKYNVCLQMETMYLLDHMRSVLLTLLVIFCGVLAVSDCLSDV